MRRNIAPPSSSSQEETPVAPGVLGRYRWHVGRTSEFSTKGWGMIVPAEEGRAPAADPPLVCQAAFASRPRSLFGVGVKACPRALIFRLRKLRASPPCSTQEASPDQKPALHSSAVNVWRRGSCPLRKRPPDSLKSGSGGGSESLNEKSEGSGAAAAVKASSGSSW